MNPPARASSRFRLYGLGALVMCVGLAWACDGYDSHIYTGELFEQTRNCLDQVSSVDVVDGVTPTATCQPICLILPTYDGDGGNEAFVSSMCPPLPPAANTTQLDPRCPPALEAYNTDNFCLDGGGSTNPPGSSLPFADAAPAPVDAGNAVDSAAPQDAGAPTDAGAVLDAADADAG